MNEFEWLRQTRALNTPVAPSRDLWTGIHANLHAPDAAPARRSRRSVLPWAMAAAVLLLSVFAGGLALRQATPAPHTRYAQMASPWKPNDPRLTGAAIELHAARSELTQALQQAPNAAFLQRLLQRTAEQRSRLQQLDHQSS